jgi:hypothetical protein
VHGRDLVLEVGVAHDDPCVAVRVVATLELRSAVRRNGFEQLLDVALGAREVAGREALEDDRSDAGSLEVQLGLERDRRGREREEPLGGRRLQLLAPEEDVGGPMP